MTIKMGDRGDAVRTLQLQLAALHYSPGDIDGAFGPRTEAALKRFQTDREKLSVTGELDAETQGQLEQALAHKPTQTQGSLDTTTAPVPCEAETWTEFLALKDLLTTNTPVKYGPGRGLFLNGQWMVTQGPGRLSRTDWKSLPGDHYPSFVCTCWTNFFLGWLLRYNERWTHAGAAAGLFEICEAPEDTLSHSKDKDDKEPFRGYGPHLSPIRTDGSTFARQRFADALDMRELYDRRKTLPTFMIMGQSTRTAGGGWNTWHHTNVFVIDHSAPDAPMHRMAADGYKVKGTNAYSGTPFAWKPINEDTIPVYLHSEVYRGYGVNSPDGTYPGTGPRPQVVLELATRSAQYSEHGPAQTSAE